MKKLLVLLGFYLCLVLADENVVPWDEDPQHIHVQGAIFQAIEQDVAMFCTGGYHTVYLTKQGKLIETGLRVENAAQGPENRWEITLPTESKMVNIYCGDYMTIAKTEDSSIYSWGNFEAPLGRKDVIKETSFIPMKIEGSLSGKSVTNVAAGYTHALASTATETVYSWGNSQYGQLGLKQTKEYQFSMPALIKQAEWKKTKQICAGGAHSMALSEDGRVYTIGWNGFGQLGSPQQELPFSHLSIPVGFEEPIQKISCGGEFNLALSQNGKVYSWGWNEEGQLGTKSLENERLPVDISLNFPANTKIVDIFAGRYATAFAISENGDLYGWGSNEDGQLGSAVKDMRSSIPTKLDFPGKAVSVAAGYKHTMVLDDKNVLYGVGDNSFQQMGKSNQLFEEEL